MSAATRAHGPATKGKRQQVATPRRSPLAVPTAYVATARPLRYGNHTLPEGVEVPGAANWPRLDTWIAARRVRPVFDEGYKTYEAFLNEYAAQAAVAAAEAFAQVLETAPAEAAPTEVASTEE